MAASNTLVARQKAKISQFHLIILYTALLADLAQSPTGLSFYHT